MHEANDEKDLQARKLKAQRLINEARAQAELAATIDQRAKIRSHAVLEAELLTETCDYAQADAV